MGQKVNPKGFRVGVTETWDSIWFSGKKEYGALLLEDLKLRKYIKHNLYKAGISKILINRRANQIEVNVYSAKPGLVIGRGGREVGRHGRHQRHDAVLRTDAVGNGYQRQFVCRRRGQRHHSQDHALGDELGRKNRWRKSQEAG